MGIVHSEQTTQTIGKARFIVVSSFNPTGQSAQENIAKLLRREAGLDPAKRFDNTGQARYNKKVNTV